MRRSSDAVASVLPPQYQLGPLLHYGPMTDVWRARETGSGREVVVKCLNLNSLITPATVERFRKELVLSRAVGGRHAPQVLSEFEGPPAGFVMEYGGDQTLKQLAQAGSLTIATACQLGCRAAEALSVVHCAGVIHRDVKPANFVVDETNHVRVIDFGIALRFGEVDRLMDDGRVIGTVDYMSPEQVQGFQVDYLSDIYGFGVVLFELFTGEKLFVGDNTVAVAMQHARSKPRRLEEVRPEVPIALARMVGRCLNKQPTDRPQSLAEVIAVLRRYERFTPGVTRVSVKGLRGFGWEISRRPLLARFGLKALKRLTE